MDKPLLSVTHGQCDARRHDSVLNLVKGILVTGNILGCCSLEILQSYIVDIFLAAVFIYYQTPSEKCELLI